MDVVVAVVQIGVLVLITVSTVGAVLVVWRDDQRWINGRVR
jgi:hypothetical protein